MSNLNGDAPAFPQPFIHESDKGEFGYYTSPCDIGRAGLTKREEFAKAALQGLLSDPTTGALNVDPKDFASRMVKAAVCYADALLAELEKKQ